MPSWPVMAASSPLSDIELGIGDGGVFNKSNRSAGHTSDASSLSVLSNLNFRSRSADSFSGINELLAISIVSYRSPVMW